MHEAILNRLRVPGQQEGSNTKVGCAPVFRACPAHHHTSILQLARTLRIIRGPIPRTPWTTLLDQVKGDIVTAEKYDILESRDLNKVANLEKYRRESRSGV